MTDRENSQGCVGWLLEWAVFILGAILMFAKTSELLSAFAPREWFGFVEIESLYGAVSALMVEGLFVALKMANDPVLNGRPRTTGQWIGNTVIMLIPFSISLLAQPLDAFVIQGTLASQPTEIQLLVSWLVPMIPGLIVGLILMKSLLDNLPPEIQEKFRGAKSVWVSAEKPQKPTVDLHEIKWLKWPWRKNGKAKSPEKEEETEKTADPI